MGEAAYSITQIYPTTIYVNRLISSHIANIFLDKQNNIAYDCIVLGFTEEKVITPRVSFADSRRVLTLYRLAMSPVPILREWTGKRSETQLVTSWVSGTSDLAATFRLSAGGDITLQFCRVSSRKEYI